jgi:hypothetical protein
MTATAAKRRAAVIESFREQIRWCDELGAPFTSRLLAGALQDLEANGWLAQRIGDWSGHPIADALPLRVAGALHALVLSGAAPALARHYPPHDKPDDALRSLQDNSALLDRYLAAAPQTNEIGRAALLYAAFSDIAARRALPLRLLEIGASAGLNLQWDRYRYRLGDATRGDASSAVEIACEWSGPLPSATRAIVRDRRGCDVAPIDLADPAQQLRLRSYVWPDHADRLARLDAAIAVALSAGSPAVDAADAAAWLPAQLARMERGVATVVFHTIVWMYLPRATRDALRSVIEEAGRRATEDCPLGWLSFEFPTRNQPAQLTLVEWPGGVTRTLAEAHPHGRWVRWQDSRS